MSTERTRQRADRRSADASHSKKTRKYHFASINYDGLEGDGWTGVVLPPRYSKAGPKSVVSMGTRYNFDGLLAHLFFWDRAAIPRPGKDQKLPEDFDLIEHCHNQVLSAAANDRIFEFTQERVFEEPRFHNRRSVRRSEIYRVSDLEWENQVQTFFALEKRNPGVWSIADPYFNHRKLRMGRSLLVRLYDAIPVPAQDVRLLQVAEFKSRHRADLLSLRRQLSRLFLKIERSHDADFEFRTEFSALKDAVTDLIISMEKDRLPLSFASLDARLILEFDYKIPLAAGIIVGSLANLQDALTAAAAGAAANLIPKVQLSAARGKIRGTGNPLAYAYLISENFGDGMPYAALNSAHFLEDGAQETEE